MLPTMAIATASDTAIRSRRGAFLSRGTGLVSLFGETGARTASIGVGVTARRRGARGLSRGLSGRLATRLRVRIRMQDERRQGRGRESDIGIVLVWRLLDELLDEEGLPLQLDVEVLGHIRHQEDDERLEQIADPLKQNEDPELECDRVVLQHIHREDRQTSIGQHRNHREQEEHRLPHADVFAAARKEALIEVQQSPGIALELCEGGQTGEDSRDGQCGNEESAITELDADLGIVLQSIGLTVILQERRENQTNCKTNEDRCLT